ncbi:ABC transporter ATP-binding protein [Candidatus Saccharibacteria bacterium]|nr:ABC transporter ATP-binding protein [Candidatus Saccharibacteria bacterium]
MSNNKTEKFPQTWRRTIHYFWQANKKYKLLTFGAFITTPIVYMLRAFCLILMSDMIGVVSLGLPFEELKNRLLPLALLLVGEEVVRHFIIGPIRMYCVWEMEIRTMRDLSLQCFDSISAQSMQFHSDRFSGSLISQTNNFVSSYEKLMDEFFWNIFPVILDILFAIIILAPRAPLFTTVLVSIVVIFIIISIFWSKRLSKISKKEAVAYNRRTGQLADAISNIGSVKSYANEKYEQKRFLSSLHNVYKISQRFLFENTKRNYCFNTIFLMINIGLIIFMLYGQNFFGLSVSTIVLIINYSDTISGDLWSVHSVFKSLNRIFGDSHEMTLNLDLEDDVVDLPGATKLKINSAEIKFSDVAFKHQDAKVAIFKDFNLNIKPGERVGLVGVSGSGKTTLTKLLLRFADVDQGEIAIDGQNIKYVTQDSLRKNIAYVPQETALFHRSIAENIAYGKPEATFTEIQHAAKLANADEFIKVLPNGYETLVGERGIKLSGGQRQRIAIARAILKDAPILVLDEATSALDSESEALIQEALRKLIKGRTSIVIAHRLSTVMDLDRIIVLEAGKIVESGSHAELLKAGGTYAKLWSHQSGAFLD